MRALLPKIRPFGDSGSLKKLKMLNFKMFLENEDFLINIKDSHYKYSQRLRPMIDLSYMNM
jgi:hypothetical protein